MSSQIQNFYPSFAPNQVLTDTQLNQLRIYLDEQNRLTRTRMIGTGIICGLHAKYDFKEPKIDQETHTISISKGYGVTSDGYLIDFEGAIYTQYRVYAPLDLDEDGSYDYKAWTEAKNPIFELVPTGALTGVDKVIYQDSPIKQLSEVEIDCRILVLFLECKPVDLKSCAINDCSNKGEQIEINIKALLVHENDLTAVVPAARLTDEDLTPLKSLLIHVPRFHHAIYGPNDDYCKLQLINGVDDIRFAYGKIVQSSSLDFIEKVNKIIKDNEERNNFLDLPDSSRMQDRLKILIDLKQSPDDFNQYHYGFIRDLACGFNEFLAAYCKLVKDCCSPTGYPRHLMLRRLIDDTPAENGGYYRHEFVPTAAKNAQSESWHTTRKLFMRLMAMIADFRGDMVKTYKSLAEGSEGVRITLSQEALHPLGAQALPYYYRAWDGNKAKTTIVKYWQAATACLMDPLHSYYYQKDGLPAKTIPNYDTEPLPNYSDYPLYYGILKNSFYRIEGHLGGNCEKVKQELETLCKIHNLDFEVLVLYTSLPSGSPSDAKLFKDFAAKKWGMEYMGGVKPGGTFVLVCDPDCPESPGDDIIVADFALDCCVRQVTEAPPDQRECPSITAIRSSENDPTGNGIYYALHIQLAGPDPDSVRIDWGDGSDIEEPTDLTSLIHFYPYPGRTPKDYVVVVTIEGPRTCKAQAEHTITLRPQSVRSISKPAVSPPTQKSKSASKGEKSGASQNLGTRRQARLQTLYAFNESGTYKKNRTYQSAIEFASDDKISASDLNSEFRDVLGKLKSVYKRASGQKESDYQSMLLLVMEAYLDRLVELTPSALPTGAKETISEEVADLNNEYGLKAADLKKAWKAAEVKKISDAKVVDQINKLIK